MSLYSDAERLGKKVEQFYEDSLSISLPYPLQSIHSHHCYCPLRCFRRIFQPVSYWGLGLSRKTYSTKLSEISIFFPHSAKVFYFRSSKYEREAKHVKLLTSSSLLNFHRPLLLLRNIPLISLILHWSPLGLLQNLISWSEWCSSSLIAAKTLIWGAGMIFRLLRLALAFEAIRTVRQYLHEPMWAFGLLLSICKC